MTTPALPEKSNECKHIGQGGNYCDHCGANLKEGLRKCSSCGVRAVRADAKFCFICGAPFENEKKTESGVSR